MPIPCTVNNDPYHILLTFDVEDWFQVENFKACIPFSTWSSYDLRVERNTHSLLDLLDSIKIHRSEVRPAHLASESVAGGDQKSGVGGQPPSPPGFGAPGKTEGKKSSLASPCNRQLTTNDGQDEKVRGTFFVLGWIAQRLPHLVREIKERGHEVASHGYDHNLCNEQSPDSLKRDLCDSKNLLEDLVGSQVYGYRAPSFSINNQILKLIEDCGYLYDSSFNSFGMHGRYGHIDLCENGIHGIAVKISHSFYELPVSNLKLGKRILPWAGGGYFRLIPFPVFRLGIELTLKNRGAYLFYVHPWEIDPAQPRVKHAPAFYRFRHYFNLGNTISKLIKLLKNFTFCRFITCREYLEAMENRPSKESHNGDRFGPREPQGDLYPKDFDGEYDCRMMQGERLRPHE